MWCLTVEVLATKVVAMGERAQLPEKNAPRDSMVLFVKYVQLVIVPPHCNINLDYMWACYRLHHLEIFF